MLCQAFNSNPLHPGVLNMLAHFSLLQGDLQRVSPFPFCKYLLNPLRILQANIPLHGLNGCRNNLQ